MRTIEEIVKELAEAAANQAPPTVQLVADFQLNVKVFNNGQVQISSPQNPTAQPTEPEDQAPAEIQQDSTSIPKTHKRAYPPDVKYERTGRKVNVDGITYRSMQEAARELLMHPYQVKDRCASSQWPTWYLEN